MKPSGTLAKARLQDVARLAGVHPSTASRALNDAEVPMRAATRARVLAAADSLAYRPNALALGLKRAATGSLGMLVPSLRNPVMAETIRGAFRRAWERGYVLVIAEDNDPTDNVETPESDTSVSITYDRLVATGRIDGVLMGSARPGSSLVDRIAASGIPCVFVGRRVAGSGRNASVREEEVGRIAAAHLLDLGHRCLGHVSGPPGLEIVERRLAGFQGELTRCSVSPARVAYASLDERGGYRAVEELLRGAPAPTAVFITNFAQTFGAMAAIREGGLEIPGDISLVACDDDPVFSYLDPPVTAVHMSLPELGAAAVDALITQIEQHETYEVEIEITPTLALRASTAALRINTDEL